ncbi:MAG: hypothetical protein IJ682_03745 [Lachnospiraceae bacterium]|nr:hypothetical protein [Lachnospiraceae bacterium]
MISESDVMEVAKTDKQYVGIMIEFMEDLRRLKEKAQKEEASETQELIEELMDKTDRKMMSD